MRKSGLWVVAVGIGVQLLVSVFYSITGISEAYLKSWYVSLSKAANVLDTIGIAVMLIGVVMVALTSAAPVAGPRGEPPASMPVPGPAQSSQPAAVGPQSQPATVEARLGRLRDLLEQGHLSSEEYDERRARILDTL